MATNYSENLFDAVQILVDKSLESIKFDETINVIITDASKAKNGQYIVSNGSIEFIAYSTVTDYHKNDAVMVTIPQGNYENQKIIIGKQIAKDNTPLTYKSPMENMVNLTNNIIPDNSNLKVEMWANSSDYAWNEGSKLSESDVYTVIEDDKLKYCLWDSNDCNTEFFYQKYDALGLSAQFSTWLNEYNTVTGNYGLILEVTFKDLNTQENFAKIYSCQFDSDEFFGDVYNFETYYTQEKVFDLSDYKDSAIVRLRLFPYQRCNFTTIEGEDVPYSDVDDFSDIPPNIYMKDFIISLGNYISETTEDTAEIMTDSSMTYDKNIQNDLSEYDPVWITNYLLNNKNLLSLNTELVIHGLIQLLNSYNSGEIIKIEHEAEFKRLLQNYDYENIEDNFIIPIMNERNRETNNLKYINLRWVHIFEDVIKVVEEDEIPEDYEIRWYRYKPGAPSPDQFSGAHWEYLAAAGEESSTLNKITVEFQPNVNNNEEKIKVIIIKKEEDVQGNFKEYKIATSNVLEFTNNTQIRDSVTIEDLSALTLRVDDNFHGNYLLYDRSGKLSKNEWNTQYSITAMFKGEPLAVEDCSLIEWIVPTENTMIHGYESIEEKTNKIFYYINDILNNNATNNTINIKIVKDGLEYAAAVTLRFGTAGTNGSDYTMALIWDNDKKAINVQPTFELDKLEGTLQLYDQSGSLVDLSSANIELSWAVATNCNLLGNDSSSSNNNYIFEDEEQDIYYPVFILNDEKSLQALTSFVDGFSIRQPDPNDEDVLENKDFYYFEQDNFNENYNYKKFNLETEQFEDFIIAENEDYGAVYRKRGNDNYKKKIEFKQVTVVNSIDQVIPGKTVLYNAQRRYFVRYHNQYILDPWSDYQAEEIYYEPLLVAPKIDDFQNGNFYLKAENIGQRITISYNAPFDNLNYIYILKVKINNFGDYPLEMYKPIALTRTQGTDLIVNYVNIAESVRYATTGEIDFNKNPFEIEVTKINSEGKSEVIKYYYKEELNADGTRILNSNDLLSPDPKPENSYGTPEPENLQGYWRLIIAENYDKWDPAEEDNQFYPSLKETALGWFKQPNNNTTYNIQKIKEGQKRSLQSRNWLTYHKPILKPPAVYYKDAAPYAIQFIRSDGEVLWTQPIFVYQDNYPSTTLNQWNGKDIITDNDTGTIVANGFAAGHKNSDNTFSGVVLGDWSRTDIDRSFAVNETGVYGFNHGAMSYALKDDGTAFFGKDGRGRIYFDGNKATIKSASWRYDKPEGMMIDLDDGILDTRSQNSQVYISPKNNRLLNIKSTYNNQQKDILFISDDNYYLKTANFDDSNKLGTKIDLKEGQITSYNLKLIGYYKPSTIDSLYDSEHPDTFYSITMDSTDHNYGYPLAIGKSDQRSFLVSWDGRLKLKNIKGGLNYIDLDSSGEDDYPLAIGTKSIKNQREFWVKWDGTLHATGADISGVINAEAGGNIAGWTINRNNLLKQSGNYQIKISSKTTDSSDVDGMGNVFEVKNGSNYPFAVKANGTLIATNADIAGTITANSGNIAGWKIGYTSLYKWTKENYDPPELNDEPFYKILLNSGTNLAYNFAVFKNVKDETEERRRDLEIFKIGWDGTLYAQNASIAGGSISIKDINNNILFNANSNGVNVKGQITATSGAIGSWTINPSNTDNGSLTKTRTYSSTNSGKIDLGGNQYAIWVNGGNFSVDYSGNMTATSGSFSGTISSSNISGTSITGGSISGTSITGGSISGASITAGGGKFVANSSGVSVNGAISATTLSATQTNGISMNGETFKSYSIDVITNIKTDSEGKIIHIYKDTISFLTTKTITISHSGGCFIAGTKILMANGSYKNIENIKENDLIISYDEINNKFVIDKVIKLLIHHNTSQLMTLILKDGTKIKSTLSHPFLTTNGWKTIDLNMAFKEHSILCQKIKIGDILIGQNHNSKIINIFYENCPVNYDTYNLFVKKYHTYIANNYIVHNAVVIAKD